MYLISFFSSPHLLEVRERIRINGTPLSKDMFVNYFWKCYNMFEKTKVRKQRNEMIFNTSLSLSVCLSLRIVTMVRCHPILVS